MSFFTKALVVTAASALAIGSVACHIGEAHTEIEYYDPHTTTQTLTCQTDDWLKPDLSKLTQCGGTKGKGHCYDRMKVSAIGGPKDPTTDVDDYADDACKDGELCIPDKILQAGGTKLQACKFGSLPGTCASRIAKRIDDNAKGGALQKQDCDGDDEVCIPCTDPTEGNRDTHVCDDIGVHTNACVGGKGASGVVLCCHGEGLCTDKSGIPGGHASDLPSDSSCKADQVCAPAALIDNKPHKCSGALGVAGVCLDYCFADVLEGAKALERGDCGPTEICLPCAIGKSQGLPGCE
jgi:hypothetical protein